MHACVLVPTRKVCSFFLVPFTYASLLDVAFLLKIKYLCIEKM